MKRLLFVSGTRADFGKLKSLIEIIKCDDNYDYSIFVTGMHMMRKYGSTINEILRSGFNCFAYLNQVDGDPMEVILANTVKGLSTYLSEFDGHFDMIIVHGDRVEALAGAIVGSLRNIPVAHIEGGEVSGTIDELMRHAISKLSHIHFVASLKAKKRLLQLGEYEDSIYVIGSPDIDVMLSSKLPHLEEVKRHYAIDFNNYAIAMFHPVTTEILELPEQVREYVDALISSGLNYVVISPNNDKGTEIIENEYQRLKSNSAFKIFPSIRFEYFLVLLRNAQFIIGNSSAGIHEAPIYGIPTINIGTRQYMRSSASSIHNVEPNGASIIDAIDLIGRKKVDFLPDFSLGKGNSALLFLEALNSTAFSVRTQKYFNEL